MEFDKMLRRLIIRQPFYGLIMLGLNKVHTDKIETLAVAKASLGIEILINDKFWESLTDDEQMAVLLHEIHHVCFHHMTMAQDFPDKKLFNCSADLEVNSYIEHLPEGHLDAKAFGFPRKQGTKWYYQQLQKKGNNSNGNNQPDGNGQNGMKTLDDHNVWKEFEKCSEAQKELIESQIDGVIKEAAKQTVKQRGTIPAQFQDLIDELLKPRERIYDWKADFRRMLGQDIELKLRNTHKKPSKRFPSSPGIKFRKRVCILVAIDTSGSVSDEELSEFFSEIDHIRKAGAKVMVIECDYNIHGDPWEYVGLHDIAITGRGGTRFSPPIDYYREHRREYTKLVYFTDGEADIDHLNVPNNDMTWVITPGGCRQKYPGKVIYMPNEKR